MSRSVDSGLRLQHIERQATGFASTECHLRGLDFIKRESDKDGLVRMSDNPELLRRRAELQRTVNRLIEPVTLLSSFDVGELFALPDHLSFGHEWMRKATTEVEKWVAGTEA